MIWDIARIITSNGIASLDYQFYDIGNIVLIHIDFIDPIWNLLLIVWIVEWVSLVRTGPADKFSIPDYIEIGIDLVHDVKEVFKNFVKIILSLSIGLGQSEAYILIVLFELLVSHIT